MYICKCGRKFYTFQILIKLARSATFLDLEAFLYIVSFLTLFRPM